MADVADDIVEEERRRNEFLREQVSRHQSSIGSSRAPIDDD
jgi:hypothetical protein